MLRALAAVVFLAGGLTACIPGPPQAEDCEWMDKKDAPPATSNHTLLLVDSSNSTRVSADREGAPDLAGFLTDEIQHAVERKDIVSIGHFSGSGVSWTVANQRTDPEQKNDKNAEVRRSRAKECLGEHLETAVSQKAGTEGTDILGALRSAVDHVRSGEAAKTIVMATDGLQTTGCADLTKAAFDDGDREITNITQVCGTRKELRENDLKNVRLVMKGIGHPSPEQPVPAPQQREWLDKLWESMCKAAGAKECAIDTAERTAAPGKAPAAVTTALDPVVSFSSRKLIVEVPGDVLFDTSVAELRAEAKERLAAIAVDIRTRKYRQVEVNGHTDTRASHDNSDKLGRQRAEKVAEYLGQHGVTNLVPRSFGKRTPKCDNEYVNGKENAAALQCNRRVEIVVTLA